MKELAFSVVFQAVHDYKFLKDNDLTSFITHDGDRISIEELTEFFHSDYCTYLLQGLQLTGDDILAYINNQYR